MFLVDTNCWIQLVREREHASSVNELFRTVSDQRLFVSDYTVHSIGNIMARYKVVDGYARFLSSLNVGTAIQIITVPTPKLSMVANACVDHRLDFDDAYRYVAAELNDLTLVSLDAGFDRTPRGRLTPAAALQRFKDEPQQPQQEA